jgi:hypothetical protein
LLRLKIEILGQTELGHDITKLYGKFKATLRGKNLRGLARGKGITYKLHNKKRQV